MVRIELVNGIRIEKHFFGFIEADAVVSLIRRRFVRVPIKFHTRHYTALNLD